MYSLKALSVRKKLILFLVSVVVFYAILGSQGFDMSDPLAVGAFNVFASRCRRDKLMRNLVLLSAVVLAAFVIKRGVCNILGQCYFDAGYRFDKTYKIDSPLATTYTTAKNCDMLNPLLKELQLYVDENDYLLCFQYCPTIHYLTHTRPYLYNPWVFTYDPDALERKLNKAENEREKLPVMVRDKGIPSLWYEQDEFWDDRNAPEDYFHNNRKLNLIHSFIARHKYHVVWENEVFQILLPAE